MKWKKVEVQERAEVAPAISNIHQSLSSSYGLGAKGDSTERRIIADFASGATITSYSQAVSAPALRSRPSRKISPGAFNSA